MGDYLPNVNLGAGVEIRECFDYSPSHSPSTWSPTIYATPSCSSLFSFSTHNCILTSTKAIKCFGLNNMGQLGYGNAINRGLNSGDMGDSLPLVDLNESILSVHIGEDFSCMFLFSNNVKCFGRNTNGQLGYGDATNRGGSIGDMGSYLPYVNLGSTSQIQKIAVGGYSSLVLFSDSTKVKGWGDNASGQLGLEDTIDRGSGLSQMGDYLPFISFPSGTQIVGISSFRWSSCVLTTTQDLFCFGSNTFGQLVCFSFYQKSHFL